MKDHLIKKLLFFTIVLFLIFNAGCWDLREINQTAVPAVLGIDLGQNKQINFTILFAQPTPPGESGGSQMENIITTSSDYSISLAARRVMLSLSRIPGWSHTQSMVLGENLVRKDLPLAIDFLNRNRVFPPDMDLFIGLQSPPEELLAGLSNTRSRLKPLVAVSEMELGEYVPITTGDFTYKLMTPGIEPAVPQIILEKIPGANTAATNRDNNSQRADNKTRSIVLHGIAVFKGPQMVGSLNENESRGYRWLGSHNKIGGLILLKSPLQPQDDVALEVSRFNSKTTPRLSSHTIKMHITVNAQLNFYEQTGSAELLTPTMLKKLEQAANLEISRQINSCINKSQQLNSDILGCGLSLQQYQPDAWKSLKTDWNNIYPLLEFDVKVKTTINHSYLTNKSFQIR